MASAFIAVLLSSLLIGCSLLKPLPKETTLKERLAVIPTDGLPLAHPVTIHWDDHQIPFVEAKTDTDLAFALGLIHAHLRLGQMELLRRISKGRLAESTGPLAVDIDHSLRILNFGRAAAAIEAALPADTRAWLEAFVKGINHYQDKLAVLPHEFSVLAFERAPWTVADVITVGRLAAIDVNWLVWFRLLKLRERQDWPRLWARLVENGSDSHASLSDDDLIGVLGNLLKGVSRSGSNSLAVMASRSATGGALIANDPHLGIVLPNLWILVGFRSPSYHAVGLMIPGVPFIGLGRNPWIAWGGTNMRAASSDLYDVSALGPDEFRGREETIRVRWWFDRTVRVRETEYGPVLSDAPVLGLEDGPPFALKWIGHQVSDEITAMLRVNRARNWAEFREAFRSFAVSGQNMLYADRDGAIGQVMAVQLPVRNGATPPDIVLDPADEDARWRGVLHSPELPAVRNPKKGFLVSANNRPADINVPIGYFFSPDDRVKRMSELLGAAAKVGLADLKAIQQDVYMPSAAALRDLLVERAAAAGLERTASADERAFLALVKGWDGHYRADSRGALAFELLFHHFSRLFYGRRFGDGEFGAFVGLARIKSLLIEDVNGPEAGAYVDDLRRAIGLAAERLKDFAVWGEFHRLGLSHPLARLPLVGARYRFLDAPVGGSTDTVMKTSHGTANGRHYTRYGSNARHISDLSDPDENYFVLLGGQDGWLKSSTFMDHVPLWLEGRYIRMPLRLETVRRTFPHKTVLGPGGAGRAARTGSRGGSRSLSGN